MSKTLDQWLASSDSDEDEQSSPTGGALAAASPVQASRRLSVGAPPAASAASSSSLTRPEAAGPPSPGSPGGPVTAATALPSPNESPAGSPTAAASPTSLEVKARQAEMRERMKKLLGDAAVARTTDEVSSTASGQSPTSAWPTAGGGGPGSNAENAHAPFGMTPTAAGNYPDGQMDFPNSGGGTTQALDPAGRHFPPPRSPTTTVSEMAGAPSDTAQPQYRPIEVMVVDRGTQTVTTTGTQTDPMPPYYMPDNSGNSGERYYGPVLLPGRGGGIDFTRANPYRGIDGRPYRQLFDDYQMRAAADADALREQLIMIQNSVDMLISRYNLPPPPGFELL